MPSTIKLCGNRSQCKAQMYIFSARFRKKNSSQTPRPISIKVRRTMSRDDPNVKGQRSKRNFCQNSKTGSLELTLNLHMHNVCAYMNVIPW